MTTLNRQQRRAQRSLQRDHLIDLKLTDTLTEIPRSQFPLSVSVPDKAWYSKKYMVQLFHEHNGIIRLSINRTRIGTNNRWEENLTWDELHAIKSELGFGDMYAVEIYPREVDVINVASMRHLWILPAPLNIGWFK